MAFKIPDNRRIVGVSGNYGSFDYPIPGAPMPSDPYISPERQTGSVTFRDFGVQRSPGNSGPPGMSPMFYGPGGSVAATPLVDFALFGRRMSFVRLDLTNTSTIDVSLIVATPSNPLGADLLSSGDVGGTTYTVERVFGSPLDDSRVVTSLSNTAWPVPNRILAHGVRMDNAKIYFRLENDAPGIADNPQTPLFTTGTLVNTAALVSYTPYQNSTPSLPPSSPLRTFSPYTITVPPSFQTNNVSLHIYQGATILPVSIPAPTITTLRGATPEPTFLPNSYTEIYNVYATPSPVFAGNSYSTGYGWAINSINLGPKNNGEYKFTKSPFYFTSEIFPASGNTSTPFISYLITAFNSNTTPFQWRESRNFLYGLDRGYFEEYDTSSPVLAGQYSEQELGTLPRTALVANVFFDTRAIVIDPASSFKTFFDGVSANTVNLEVTEKVRFSNTSIPNRNWNALTFEKVTQFSSDKPAPFRGSTGYVDHTFLSNVPYEPNVPTPLAPSFRFFTKSTRFHYANETRSVIHAMRGRLGGGISIKSIDGTRRAWSEYNLTTLDDAYLSGSGWIFNSTIPLLPTEPTGAGLKGLVDMDIRQGASGRASARMWYLRGHSEYHGYEAFVSTNYGDPGEPTPVLINLGLTPAEATNGGPTPTANRIRGSVLRYPFSNFIDISEVADTSPVTFHGSTWSSLNNIYFYGGYEPGAITWAAWYYKQAAAVGSTASFRYPFASGAPTSLTSTGAGTAIALTAAATDEYNAFIAGGHVTAATSPATVDSGPLLGTAIATDGIVTGNVDGLAGTPTQGALTGMLNGALRTAQRFPFATDTFTALGIMSPTVYSATVAMAGSDTHAYFRGGNINQPPPGPTAAPLYRGIYSGTASPGTLLDFNVYSWGKFPFAATTSVVGLTTFKAYSYPPAQSGSAWNADQSFPEPFGIYNTQSPTSSYAGSTKMVFASETLFAVEKDIDTLSGMISPGIYGPAPLGSENSIDSRLKQDRLGGGAHMFQQVLGGINF